MAIKFDNIEAINLKNHAGTNVLTLNSSNTNALFSGNVGIGMTGTPSGKLHGKGSSSGATPYALTAGANIESDNISGINILSPNNGYGRIYFGAPVSNTAGAVEYIHDATVTDGYMKLRAGGGDRVYILGTGQVGIGVQDPSLFFNQADNLVIGGEGNIGATIYSSNSGNSFLAFADVADAANSGFNAGGSIYYEHANNAMVTRVNGSERMRIDSSGVVQIRNTAPKIQLYNTDASLGANQLLGSLDFYKSDPSGAGTGTSSSIQVRSDSTNGANSYMAFYTDGGAGAQNTERMRINSTGSIVLGSSYVTPDNSNWTTSNSQLILGGAFNAEFNDDNPGVKLLITGYNNDGTTLYPIYLEDENGLTDFYIKNRASQSSLPSVFCAGSVTADSFIKSGGTSSQFLKADGSVDSSGYYTSSQITSYFKRGYINSETASSLSVGWYTIATNTGDRALGEFQIWEMAGSRHQSVLFNASHHFGQNTSNDLTVLANSKFSTDVFRYIRIKENGTYDGAALQVYIDNSTNNVAVAITGANAQVNGWVLKDWIPDATDPGDLSSYSSFTEACRIDLDNTRFGGMETTGKFFAQESIHAESTYADQLILGTTSSQSHALYVTKDLTTSASSAYFDSARATTSTYGAINVRVNNVEYGSGMAFYRQGNYGGTAIGFRDDNGIQRGTIVIGTSSTAYNETSDYRLKENVIELTNGIERVKQLQPKRFNFIGDEKTVDGFIAHEAGEVVPESVTGEKNAVLPSGDPDYQGMDKAKLVPLLTAALQEAIAKIEDLETRIENLENN